MEVVCEIMRLKENKIKDYTEMHLNPPPELIIETKKAGFIEQYTFIDGNIVVVVHKAENVSDSADKLGKTDVFKKWTTTVRKMLTLDNTVVNLSKVDVITAKCIFDLNEQYKKIRTE